MRLCKTGLWRMDAECAEEEIELLMHLPWCHIFVLVDSTTVAPQRMFLHPYKVSLCSRSNFVNT
jgi:hypothetical protein